MSDNHQRLQLFPVRGDIAQFCNGAEVTYFRSKKPVTIVVNIFNSSSSCNIIARLRDKQGNILVSETIEHRKTGPEPGGIPPTAVVNQQKTLAATGVVTLTIECACDPTIGSCSTTTICSGR